YRDRAFAPPRLRQRPACGGLGGLQDAFSHSAHSRVLRLDRRHFLALQLRRKTRLDRAYSVFSHATAAGRTAAGGTGHERAPARRRRLLRALRRERGGGGGWGPPG